MPDSIFGNKNTNKLRSAEELERYISVTSPSVWLALAAIIIFLVGTLAWCVLGRIPLKVNGVVVTKDNDTTCLVKVDKIADVKAGNEVVVGNQKLTVSYVKDYPVLVDDNFQQYVCNLGNFSYGEYVYVCVLDSDCPVPQSATIITGYLSPLKFIIN